MSTHSAYPNQGSPQELPPVHYPVLPFLGDGVGRPRKRPAMQRAGANQSRIYTPQQRLMLLDTWQRSGLPAKDFSALVGVSPHTLYGWKKRFTEEGPAGLMDRQKGQGRGSRLDEPTKRAILMMKEEHPDWGVDRISAMLQRGPAFSASPGAISRVLSEAGYTAEQRPSSKPHPDKIRHFERAKPNQLWQTDLFTFVMKRQNRRVHMVVFMDDHSRYIVSWGLHASASTAMVLEAARGGIASYGAPEEILTDNGPQYITWRGKSRFAKWCGSQGIRQVVARPRRPQTLGKVERFWQTLWRECVEEAVFVDLGDAHKRIGHFIDYYNFQRTHGGIDNLVPADRFFGAADAVRSTLEQRVAENARSLALHGVPKAPLYLTGNIDGEAISVHGAGGRVMVTRSGSDVEEVDVGEPADGAAAVLPEPVAMPSQVVAAGMEEAAVPSLPSVDAVADAPPEPGVSPIDPLVALLGDEEDDDVQDDDCQDDDTDAVTVVVDPDPDQESGFDVFDDHDVIVAEERDTDGDDAAEEDQV